MVLLTLQDTIQYKGNNIMNIVNTQDIVTGGTYRPYKLSSTCYIVPTCRVRGILQAFQFKTFSAATKKAYELNHPPKEVDDLASMSIVTRKVITLNNLFSVAIDALMDANKGIPFSSKSQAMKDINMARQAKKDFMRSLEGRT